VAHEQQVVRRARQPVQGGRQAAADACGGQRHCRWQTYCQNAVLLLITRAVSPLLLLLLLLLLLRLLSENCCGVGHWRHHHIAAAQCDRQPAHPVLLCPTQ
jgi:hypothetical protein